MSAAVQGARGLDLRIGRPWSPGWFWSDAHVSAWPVTIRHAFLFAYLRADWRAGYYHLDPLGLKAYAGLDSDPRIAVELWAGAGLVVLIRPGLIRFTSWVSDQHKNRRSWTAEAGLKAFRLVEEIEGYEVAKSLFPGEVPAPVSGLLSEATPPRRIGGGGTPPPLPERVGVDGSLKDKATGWTDEAATGWAHAVLAPVGVLVLSPAPWSVHALAVLLTRLGPDVVRLAGSKAAEDSLVGGFEAFMRSVMRYISKGTASRCRHDRAEVGTVCLGCQALKETEAVATESQKKPARGSVPSASTIPPHDGDQAQNERPAGYWVAEFKRQCAEADKAAKMATGPAPKKRGSK